MYNRRCGRRSINISLLGNIEVRKTDIIFKWIRGISVSVLILSLLIYILKYLFIELTSGLFTMKTEIEDIPTSDKDNKNYSYNFSYTDKNNNNIINDKNITKDDEFILNEQKFAPYIQNYNLTLYESNKKKRNKELNYLYELFKFNDRGEESPLLIDYSSSLPHFPLFAKENDKCFRRGEIISKINQIINLTCVDISGIIYNDNNFFIRFSLLDKNSSDIKLYIFKEINVKNEIDRNDGRHNVIMYEKNNTKKNVRYCSKELLDISKSYGNMPKNYIPVIEINWPNKTQYFCFRSIELFYEK